MLSKIFSSSLQNRNKTLFDITRNLSNLTDYSIFHIKKTEKDKTKPISTSIPHINTPISAITSPSSSLKKINKKVTKFLTKFSLSPRKISSYFHDLGVKNDLEISFLCDKEKILLNDKPVPSPDTTVNVNKSTIVIKSFSFVNSDGKKINIDKPIVYYPLPLLSVYVKPLGMQSTTYDPLGRTSFEEAFNEHPQYRGMHQVGRLDSDTSGIILFSSSGVLTHTLLDPNNKIEREYEALVIGHLKNNDEIEKLKKNLSDGIQLSDCKAKGNLLYCRSYTLEDSPHEFNYLKNKAMNSYRTYHNTPLSEDYTSITHIKLNTNEGKNRVVRRMLFNSGFPCVMLHRSSFGPFKAKLNSSAFEIDENAPATLLRSPWAYQVKNFGEFYVPNEDEFIKLVNVLQK